MKKSFAALLLISAFASSSSFAGTPVTYNLSNTTTGSASKTETRAYAGLNWSLGGGFTPALVLGVFNAKVKSNGDTEGANLAFHLNLGGGIKPGKLKLSYLNGKNDLQGELGLGYDFIKSAPLLALGANGPFVAAGVDGYLSGDFVPYLTLHSQDRFKKPSLQTTACTPVNGFSGAFMDSSCLNPNNL